MKNLNVTLIALIAALTMMTACEFSSKHEDGSVGTKKTDYVSKLKYFRGGWFSPAPNWSHDMLIDFKQATATGFKITAKDYTDADCTKSGELTAAQTDQLFDLMGDLTYQTSTGPVMADTGVEYFEITTDTGLVTKIHLMTSEVPAGEYMATNGTNVSNYFKAIEAGLAVACQ